MKCTGGLSAKKGLALEAVYVGAEYREGQGSLATLGYHQLSKSASTFLARAYLSSSITVLVQYR
jgi:hypothetical protein